MLVSRGVKMLGRNKNPHEKAVADVAKELAETRRMLRRELRGVSDPHEADTAVTLVSELLAKQALIREVGPAAVGYARREPEGVEPPHVTDMYRHYDTAVERRMVAQEEYMGSNLSEFARSGYGVETERLVRDRVTRFRDYRRDVDPTADAASPYASYSSFTQSLPTGASALHERVEVAERAVDQLRLVSPVRSMNESLADSMVYSDYDEAVGELAEHNADVIDRNLSYAEQIGDPTMHSESLDEFRDFRMRELMLANDTKERDAELTPEWLAERKATVAAMREAERTERAPEVKQPSEPKQSIRSRDEDLLRDAAGVSTGLDHDYGV